MSQFTMEAKEFQAAMKAVQHAAVKNDARPQLRGVHLETWWGKARFTATDGHRLARYTIPATETHGTSIFIPLAAVKDILSLPCGDGLARIEIDGENYKVALPRKLEKGDTVYRIESRTVAAARISPDFGPGSRLVPEKTVYLRVGCRDGVEVSRKIATTSQVRAAAAPVVRWPIEGHGKFPDVDRTIPQSFAGGAVFDRAELTHALKMVGAFCRNVDTGPIQPVALKFSPRGAMLQSERTERGDFEVDVEAAHDLGGTIGFNAAYLAEALKSADCGTVWAGFNDALQPLMFQFSDRHFEVVMPLRIEWGGGFKAVPVLEAAA